MIRSLMVEPNGDDPLVPDIAQLFRRDPDAWKREAMRHAKVDATEEKARALEQRLSSGARSRAGNDAGNDNSGPSSSSSQQVYKEKSKLKSGVKNEASSNSSKKQKVAAEGELG